MNVLDSHHLWAKNALHYQVLPIWCQEYHQHFHLEELWILQLKYYDWAHGNRKIFRLMCHRRRTEGFKILWICCRGLLHMWRSHSQVVQNLWTATFPQLRLNTASRCSATSTAGNPRVPNKLQSFREKLRKHWGSQLGLDSALLWLKSFF